MGIVVGKVEEEGFLCLAALADDFVGAIGVEFSELVEWGPFMDKFVVVVKLGSVAEVAGHAVVGLETLLPGEELGFGAEVPFPDHVGGIVLSEELLGEGNFIGVEAEEPVGSAVWVDAHVETRALGVSASEEGCTGGGTDGSARVEVGELETLFGELVDVGCFNGLGAETGDVGVAEVISEDEDDVGLVRGYRRSA